jgi:hypothetical protein
LIPVLILLCGYSCGAPLAPGYQILKSSYEVRFVAGPPCQLRIHIVYKLQNTGNSDLTFLDVKFPDEKEFGRKDLRAQIEGSAHEPLLLTPESEANRPNTLRISLDSPWKRGQTRILSIEYTFESPENSGSLITLGENEFHLGTRDWFPELQPPKHLLAPNPQSRTTASYAVQIPADFVVLARGTPKGQSRDGGELAHRFELGKDDGPPFVVAGRYLRTPVKSRSDSAVFWTLEPLPEATSPAAEQIAAAWKTLEAAFGPLDRNISAPHVVESPELRTHSWSEPGAAAVAFPGGAIANPAAFALGTSHDAFLDVVIHALAHNWFGDELRPSPEASIGIGEGLPEYATIVVEEARSGPVGRRRRVLEYVRRYNDALTQAEETPLGVALLTDPIGPRRIALAKAPLFYIALEDTCGESEVRQGLARLVTLLAGQEIDYSDLRAALEQSTNRNLGQMFRIWLNGKGLPQDFLERYRLGSPNQETGL